RVELLSVAAPKLKKALGPMPEPCPQLRARCDLLHPCGGRERRLRHASRPQALDQDAPSVAALRRGVGSLDSNPGAVLRRRGAVRSARLVLRFVYARHDL